MILKSFQTMRMNKKKLKSKNLNKKTKNNNQKRLKEKLKGKNKYNHHQKLYEREEKFSSQRQVTNTI